MTHQRVTSIYISHLAISLFLLLLAAMPADAQQSGRSRKSVAVADTVPLMRGFSVSADLVGPVMMAVSDYGQYEAALHLNLKDKYFPVFELGYGKADHTEETTQLSYKTSAPFFRIGADFNVLKNKHDIYRLLVGARYGFTSFKYDLSSPGVEDPVWGETTPYEANGVKCSYHWLEVAAGVDVKLVGPVHLGWSVRYKQRLSANEGTLGKSWYVPGYGETGTSAFGALFNVSIDI